MSQRAKSRSKETKERAQKALGAMREFGFPIDQSTTVLKRLLKEYDRKWEHIEADNYSLLVDALVKQDEPGESSEREKKKPDDDELDDNRMDGGAELRKRPRRNDQGPPTPVRDSRTRGECSSQSFVLKDLPSLERPSGARDELMSKEKDVVDDQTNNRSLIHYSKKSKMQSVLAEKPQPLIPYKVPKIEPGIESSSSRNALITYSPVNDGPASYGCPVIDQPIAVIPPAPISVVTIKDKGNPTRGDSGHRANAAVARSAEPPDRTCKGCDLASKSENDKIVNNGDSSFNNIEVAASPNGRVKLSLSLDGGNKDFRISDIESLMKMVEDKCLKSYKILPPNFSLLNLMKEVCETVAELEDPNRENEEDVINGTPALDCSNILHSQNSEGLPKQLLNALPNIHIEQASGSSDMNGSESTFPENRNEGCSSGAGPLALLLDRPHEPALGDQRPLHDVNDIAKGTERVRISVATDAAANQCPTTFHYIPENIVYQEGHVNFSLARIGDEDCCSDCFGNCLSSAIPCACARETGGEYAYDTYGLLKKRFLDDCLSMLDCPQPHHYTYCQDCPIERAKNEVCPEACKGHLLRKFIKECWAKCGCSMHCGNRVVQRGITCNLQVFPTLEGKGWGVRTLDEMPRGAFVCQYVGEVLTNMELYDRTIKTTGNARHTYPVLLDADWGAEGVLKDEEALCLDATFFGNVARFINHRCGDANLIEVPVQIETPDHHYYHLAFFTKRKIEALEELTWDYGIDFDDHDHPVKAFSCSCGSKFCRDVARRARKGKSLAVVSR